MTRRRLPPLLQVDTLTSRHSIYLTRNGRISMAGVNTKNVARLAEASFKQGVIQTDVTKQAAELFDDSMAREIRGRR